MEAYYELSYIDVFGNGSYDYFYCTEDEIKQKAKTLFGKEVTLAVDEQGLEECGMAKKSFKFYDETCKGYVVKEVGITLPHHIDWKRLPFSPKNKNIKNIYVLQEQCHYMTSSYTDVYSNLQEAKKQMKIHLAKPSEIAVEDEDGNRLPNGIIKKTKRGLICSYFYWSKTSYEYDEWDIEASSVTLTAFKVSGIQK